MKMKVRDLETELRQANDHIQCLMVMGQEKQSQIEYLENKVRKLNKQSNEHQGLMQQKLSEQQQKHDQEKAQLIKRSEVNYAQTTP
jgi:hypothetical protein